MVSLFDVSVNFDRSHLIFPTIISLILVALLIAILVTRRKVIMAGLSATPRWPAGIDRWRFFGTVGLVIVYFLAMEQIGLIFPNRGLGFLFASMPFVFLISVLYMHGLPRRAVLIAAANAVLSPLAVWFILSSLFNVSLP